MKVRFYSLVWLSALFISCDKPETVKNAKAPEEVKQPPRITKSDRPVLEDSPGSSATVSLAFKNASAVTDPEERNRALAAAVWDALELDPQLAREGFAQMTAGTEEKNRLVEHLAMRLAEQNADQAVEWAKSLESDEEKSLAFGKIALVLSEKEPARAAQILSDSGVAGRDFDVAVVQVLQRWASSSPADAAAWVVLFNPGEARTAGLKEVISTWMTSDPKKAFAWIPSIQDTSMRQEAEQGAAQSILDQPGITQKELLKSSSPGIRARFEKLKAEADEE